MTIQDRILEYLRAHPEGVDDDSLTIALGLAQRQQANQRCRRMEQFGLVVRWRVNGKLRNFACSEPPVTLTVLAPGQMPEEGSWFWEGNVQARVVEHITRLGYKIAFTADTASKQKGKDIIANSPSGKTLWTSAKGYPAGTVKTSPRTQARHWFSHAVFDLVIWHSEDASAELALAFPNQVTYHNLAVRVRWLLEYLGASIYWVDESGEVSCQQASEAE